MNERKNIPAELYPLKFINLSLSKLILSELIAELMIVRIISEHKDHSVFLDKYSHPSVKQSGVLSVCLSNSLGCCLCVCQTVRVLSVCQQLGLILIYNVTHIKDMITD